MTTTAAAPAVKAKDLECGRESNAFEESVVVPMTCFRESVRSVRAAFTGDLTAVALAKGELDGVSRKLPKVGLIIRELEGVHDISRRSSTGNVALSPVSRTSQFLMSTALAASIARVGRPREGMSDA